MRVLMLRRSRGNGVTVAEVTALMALFIAAYWVPLKAMVSIWWNDDDYSYAFLIPLVSAYLVWDNRKALTKLQPRNYWPALPLLVLFILVSLYGILGSSGSASMPSIPVLLILFTAFVFGIDAARRFIVPLCFLFLMIPIPAVIEGSLGVFLKSISSNLGGAIIDLFNIPVHVSGNVIDLGVIQLQVVDACSGMRYLFALLALGVVYAYFFERATWKKIFCVLVTIPIAVATNALRIGITGILSARYGSGVAEGFFHGLSGWVLFMVAFAFLFVIGRVLRFFPPNSLPHPAEEEDDNEGRATGGTRPANIKKGFLVSIVLLLIVGSLSFSAKALPALKIHGNMASFPVVFSGWEGRQEPVDPGIILQSGAEDAFSASYRKADFGQVSLYMGYRSSAFLSDENFFHSPTVCLPAAGWKELSTSTHVIRDIPPFGNVRVVEMVIQDANTKQLVYFWFQTKNEATDDKNINRFHLALHAIKRDNTHDLFIRPITPINKNETVEQAESRMDGFVGDMMPVLFKFLQEKQYEEK